MKCLRQNGKDAVVSKLVLFIMSVFRCNNWWVCLSMYYLRNSSQSFRMPSPFHARFLSSCADRWDSQPQSWLHNPQSTSTLGFGFCLTCLCHGWMQPDWDHTIKNRIVAIQVWFNCRGGALKQKLTLLTLVGKALFWESGCLNGG